VKNIVFLDTNVVIDALSYRPPFGEAASAIFSLADSKKIRLSVSAVTFTTADYVLSKYYGHDVTISKLRRFKTLCKIVALDQEIIEKALDSEFVDFEDAVQYYSALNGSAEIIITRNTKDFIASGLPVIDPAGYLKSL